MHLLVKSALKSVLQAAEIEHNYLCVNRVAGYIMGLVVFIKDLLGSVFQDTA